VFLCSLSFGSYTCSTESGYKEPLTEISPENLLVIEETLKNLNILYPGTYIPPKKIVRVERKLPEAADLADL
jgi:uncharacterized protein (UPF0248 family)